MMHCFWEASGAEPRSHVSVQRDAPFILDPVDIVEPTEWD